VFISRDLFRLAVPGVAALGVIAADAHAQGALPPVTLQVYNADAGSFHVNAVLVSGSNDAVLLDTGFTRADALRIAAMVLDSRKRLTTIYISQADPDFYFGIDTLKQFFPDAKVVATAPTVQKIQTTLPAKLQVWGPRLGMNAPKAVPLPDVLRGTTIALEDQVLEIRGLDQPLPQRSYVWIPSIKAIAGGVNVFAGLHAWTADTQGSQERADWIKKLNELVQKHYPNHVVTDHWPTFNVADIAICVGVALMAIDMLTSRRKKSPKLAEPDVPLEPVPASVAPVAGPDPAPPADS